MAFATAPQVLLVELRPAATPTALSEVLARPPKGRGGRSPALLGALVVLVGILAALLATR